MQIGNGNRAKDWLWGRFGSYLYDAKTPVVVRTRYGPYLLGRTSNLVFRTIAGQGVWEPNLSNFITSRLRPGDTFVDVGANIGYYTVLAAQSVGREGAVVAVEPLPPALSELRRNIEINDFYNVRVLPIAAHDREGEITIRFSSMADVGGASIVWTDERPLEAVVQTQPLSTSLSRKEIASARLFKVDVEGAEATAIRGLLAGANGLRSDAEIIVELTPETYPDVAVMLAQHGFEPYLLQNPFSASNPRARPSERPQRMERAAELPPSPEGVSYVVFSRSAAATL
jgi:FkbM family methyltransferase